MTPFAFDAGMMSKDDIIKVLAIIGGGAVGAFLTGFITQAIVRGYTGQKVPTWVVWTLRGLGGFALGWLVYLVVNGHGGGLFGGLGGGEGKDGGTGGPHETGPALTVPAGSKPANKDGSTPVAAKGTVLSIEVLGDDALKKMKVAELDRYYRQLDDEPTKLLTLKDVKSLIGERLKHDPPLQRIEMILYRDSPKGGGRVDDLKNWAADLSQPGGAAKVIVDLKEPGEEAPVR